MGRRALPVLGSLHGQEKGQAQLGSWPAILQQGLILLGIFMEPILAHLYERQPRADATKLSFGIATRTDRKRAWMFGQTPPRGAKASGWGSVFDWPRHTRKHLARHDDWRSINLVPENSYQLMRATRRPSAVPWDNRWSPAGISSNEMVVIFGVSSPDAM